MEVSVEYKNTEVGIIPTDWSVNRISELAEVKTGPFGSSLHERDYVEEGTPIITVEHLSESGVLHDNLPLVSEIDKRRLKAYTLEENDIVFSRVGSVDRNALIRNGEAGWLFSGRLLRVRPNQGEIYSPYLSYYFHTESFKQRVRSVAVGQTMASLNTRILNDVFVAVPHVSEQRAIATALSDVDALITSLNTLIAKKRDMKQAAMQELLTGKRRLPGFSGKWEIKRLGNVCRITTGKKDVNEGNPFGQYPFFTCARTNTFSDSYSFEGEAILIAGNGEVGNLSYCNGRFEAYQRTYVLQNFTANVSYIWHQLTKDLATTLGIGKIGSSIPYIKKSNLVGFEFRSPIDDVEQTAIATALSDMDTEIVALEQKRDKTIALKQGMMQELLTGRIRLVKSGAA